MRFSPVILIALLFAFASAEVLNIHLRLDTDDALWVESLRYNKALHAADDSNHVTFPSEQIPHVTLFLANFTSTPDVERVVEEVVEAWRLLNLDDIAMVTDDLRLTNNWGLWGLSVLPNVTTMSTLSDMLVNALDAADLIAQPGSIPDWLAHLPDSPEKDAKIAYYRRYGSPNVFEQFWPHVTVGVYEDYAQLKAAADAAGEPRDIVTTCNTVGIARAGPYGTVPASDDALVSVYDLNIPPFEHLKTLGWLFVALGLAILVTSVVLCAGKRRDTDTLL